MKINRVYLVVSSRAQDLENGLNEKIESFENDLMVNEIIDIKYSYANSVYSALILYNTNEPL